MPVKPKTKKPSTRRGMPRRSRTTIKTSAATVPIMSAVPADVPITPIRRRGLTNIYLSGLTTEARFERELREMTKRFRSVHPDATVEMMARTLRQSAEELTRTPTRH